MSLVIAITGGATGIGRAVALRMARSGCAVAICGRRRDRLDQAADEIRAVGGQALPVVADVTSAQDMERFVRATVEQYGRLDVMVCNAGYGLYGESEAIDSAQAIDMMHVNYFGTVNGASAALPVFKRQNAGHLFIVSSIVGKRGVPYMSAYSATKFAQVGFAECLRAELTGTPIHLSVVYPISTDTEFFSVMTGHSGFATRAMGPKQSADDVAKAIEKAIARPRPEIYPYKAARILALMNAVAPGLCDRLVRRWGRKPIPV
ncbi:MAG: SDR family NAD(P)-dependent oxidoreductase [Acidobacteriaceae bacterium]|jgi:short-subunit dehydrogenase|nr:SDR family NAD(P)-dependent oxidoreductase [Acidobacteriaceae bacterium]